MKRNKFILVMIIGSLCFFCMINVDAANIINKNIKAVYKYNESGDNLCITGEESTCKSIAPTTYQGGTIVKYAVNDSEEKYFYVLNDDGETLTMQQRENTVYNTEWISAVDYQAENTNSTSCSYISCSDKGPMTVLIALENATQSWINVNDQTYTMGTTVFKDNAYTGCSNYNSCTENTYTLDERTAKARMITVQESASLGCSTYEKSCPIWMYNYLNISTSYGGTVNDTTGDYNYAYWTMSAWSINKLPVHAWFVNYAGSVGHNTPFYSGISARAVIVINKTEVEKPNSSIVEKYNNQVQKKENQSNQTVNIEDTLKNAYIGYCIGMIILILGIVTIYQSYRKEKKIIIKKY